MNSTKKKEWLHKEVLEGETKVLLHACCAPCSGAIIECMLEEGLTPVIFYSNSNIYPSEEYSLRRDECRRYAETMGVEFVEDVYDHGAWDDAVAKGFEDAPERGPRCLRCFKFRLKRAAAYASEHGYHVLATTLASSRWKSQEQIDEAGFEACASISGSAEVLSETGQATDEAVRWWNQNWRKGGLQQRRSEIIREQNFYNQLYCGCQYSLRTPEKK